MKKLFVSLGVAAAGTASLSAAYAPDATVDNSKIWTLTASLRGFYDDNIYTAPQKQGSEGVEFNPSFSLNLPLQQTEIGIRYIYGLYYYQQRENAGENPIDQSHEFDLWVDHAFSPRWEARLEDTVVVTQEPYLSSVGTATPQRIDGNNIMNTAVFGVQTAWTHDFSTHFSYQNTFYSYENSGAQIISDTGTQATVVPPGLYVLGTGSPASVNPSYAGLLDRVEQNFALELQREVSPNTTAQIGYMFGLVNFTGGELIAYGQPFPYITQPVPFYSDSRDNYSHYVYVGVQHAFRDNLTGQANVGVQYTDYYNDPSATSSLGPYATASLIYTYIPGSYAQVGLTQSRNATDTINVDSQGKITQDQESTVVYASINQAVTPKLFASFVAHYQYSIYNDGEFNNQTSSFYNLGLDLTYNFTSHWGADLGYNFDWYTTPVPGEDYTRNRIYAGVSATY